MNDEWDKGIKVISQNEFFNLVKIPSITWVNLVAPLAVSAELGKFP